MADKYVIHHYEHGGARIFIERENGSRDLVVDLYDDPPGQRRDTIIKVLMNAGLIPPESHCKVVNV